MLSIIIALFIVFHIKQKLYFFFPKVQWTLKWNWYSKWSRQQPQPANKHAAQHFFFVILDNLFVFSKQHSCVIQPKKNNNIVPPQNRERTTFIKCSRRTNKAQKRVSIIIFSPHYSAALTQMSWVYRHTEFFYRKRNNNIVYNQK